TDGAASDGPESSAVVALEFVARCLPFLTMLPPEGAEWLHEIKHPGRGLIARRNPDRVRLFGGHGEEWTASFPHLVDAMFLLPVKSCMIDGELVRCNEHGEARLEPVRAGALQLGASFYAFDVLEVTGFYLRPAAL